ncbi:transcription initiation factor TFIID component TAF4 family-domain-containing protein [Amylostereum chailletii]|nr:transcription initiation factor TFIID component TAF4 family-domain-containing protein [Amylostereum chailletii]
MSQTPMKTEGETSTQPVHPTPASTAAAYAQWNTSQIPIDPALQQHATTQYYQYSQHYPQASYGHYQPYIPQPAAHTQAQPSAATAVARPVAPATTSASQLDTADVATLNDALGSAGVDLRAEEESLQRTSDQHQSYRPYEDRSHKQPAKPNFDKRFLGPTIRKIGTKHKITKVPEESVDYLALALRTRLQDLVTSMIAASAHRNDTAYDRAPSMYEDGTPMWSVSVRIDVAKQLAALEKAEREEEMRIRRERKELAAAQAAALATHAPGVPAGATVDMTDDSEGPKKKKKKTDGPGVTAKNMSEDVRKKMSNAVASQAAGLGTGKYAWMNASASVPPPKPKPAATPSPSPMGPNGSAKSSTGSGWSKPYISTTKPSTPPQPGDSRQLVTLRDALFVVERERGHGGGRGAARGWT